MLYQSELINSVIWVKSLQFPKSFHLNLWTQSRGENNSTFVLYRLLEPKPLHNFRDHSFPSCRN